jgi:hypothetical protein
VEDRLRLLSLPLSFLLDHWNADHLDRVNALSNQSIKELTMMRSATFAMAGLPRATYPGSGKYLMGLSQEMVRCVCKLVRMLVFL